MFLAGLSIRTNSFHFLVDDFDGLFEDAEAQWKVCVDSCRSLRLKIYVSSSIQKLNAI